MESIVISVADRGRAASEVVAAIGNDWLSVLEVLDRLGPASRLRLCYEAGLTGFDLARRLTDAGRTFDDRDRRLPPLRASERLDEVFEVAHFSSASRKNRAFWHPTREPQDMRKQFDRLNAGLGATRNFKTDASRGDPTRTTHVFLNCAA